jgi:hypothetical protein
LALTPQRQSFRHDRIQAQINYRLRHPPSVHDAELGLTGELLDAVFGDGVPEWPSWIDAARQELDALDTTLKSSTSPGQPRRPILGRPSWRQGPPVRTLDDMLGAPAGGHSGQGCPCMQCSRSKP